MLAPGAAMERRHEAMRRIERDFIQAFPFIAALVRAEAALDGDGQQRALHRIAFHRPFPLLLAELGIVAENAAAEDVRGRAGRRWIILTFGLERAFLPIAGAAPTPFMALERPEERGVRKEGD